jgi:hypothetical protein
MLIAAHLLLHHTSSQNGFHRQRGINVHSVGYDPHAHFNQKEDDEDNFGFDERVVDDGRITAHKRILQRQQDAGGLEEEEEEEGERGSVYVSFLS